MTVAAVTTIVFVVGLWVGAFFVTAAGAFLAPERPAPIVRWAYNPPGLSLQTPFCSNALSWKDR